MVQRSILSTLVLSASAFALPVCALAQAAAEAPAVNADDIVVTAQKRSEAIQTVPISISAFNADTLAVAGINAPGDLQRLAPTLKFATSIGTLASRFSIRGIGSFSNSAIEPSVATFIDGIYVPRPASIVNSMLDVQGVEVLSGPQGTLFGRNASVGALSFRTGAPKNEFSADAKAEISTGDRYRLEGAVNMPVSDKVAVRVAGLADTFDGYWKDDLTGGNFGGLDTYQGRISVKTDFTQNLTWTLRGEYQKNEGDGLLNAKLLPSTLNATTLGRLTAAQNGIAPNLDVFDGHNNSFNGNASVDDSTWGVSSDLSYDTDSGYTYRLLNGYWDWDSNQGDGDTASLSSYVLARDLNYQSQSHSHELQVISPKDVLLGGRLDYVAGLYYFEEDLGIKQNSINGADFCNVLVPNPALAGPFGGLPGATTADKVASCNALTDKYSSVSNFEQNTKSLAAYAQATYAITEKLDFTGGLRYTDEEKSGSYVGSIVNPTGALILTNENTPNLNLSDSRITWRANLAYTPVDDVMLFATASTGFKSGGFNNGIATRVLGQARVFDAEEVTNYELGVKSQWFDRALTLNATAYSMDIDNFQERSIIGLISSIRNVGEVRQQGLEFEIIGRPRENVRLNASLAYLDSEILSYPNAPRPPFQGAVPNPNPAFPNGTQDLKGARLNYTPKWSGSIGAEVEGDFGASLTWRLNGDISFTSSQKQGTTIDNGNLTVQDGYALLNGRFTLYGPEEKWSLAFFGRNLTDKGYCSSTVYQVLEGPLGLRWDANGDGANDTTAVRCNVGAPRVIGVAAAVRF